SIKRTQDAISEAVVEKLVSGGVLLYAGVGFYCLFCDGNFLEYNVLADTPSHGQHIGILLVEAGVGITVFAAMLILFYKFASRGRP
ncbi:MAG: MnhB domain-containing protein, partial [Myxococcota bacterium]|nr:MnhB domain-containing protein [Myxococcota bacterium]